LELLDTYFPDFTLEQKESLLKYSQWLLEKNQFINLISRKDTSEVVLHHIIHSLVLSREVEFQEGMHILDIGTGGGLPGIPLAIVFPHVRFHLIDSILKKTTAVNEAIEYLNLTNATCEQARAEEVKDRYDMIVSRAVARLLKLWNWSRPLMNGKKHNALICLKGGDLKDELAELNKTKIHSVPVTNYVDDTFFKEKYIIKVIA